MNKSEAAAVLHEIFDVIGESVCISSVSLDNLDSFVVRGDRGYQIKMKCVLDGDSRDSILPILGKKNLEIREENGYVLISKIHF